MDSEPGVRRCKQTATSRMDAQQGPAGEHRQPESNPEIGHSKKEHKKECVCVSS